MSDYFRNNMVLFVLLVGGAFFVAPSLNSSSGLMNKEMAYCCPKEGWAKTEHLDMSVIQEISSSTRVNISKEQAGVIAERHTGGKLTDISYLSPENKRTYRVKTTTRNSGKAYETGIDAQTGKILFSDEVWWLQDLF
ncbi:PepSY domain-containing protein [Kiloniella sp.]|uniref:PepSY domain-containing protein n=1 Tax=Kiloniella sp. TaxID=1938587 RepID=UPI003B013648